MLASLKELFAFTEDANHQASDQINPALAAAALMFEVIWSDHAINDQEVEQIETSLQSLYALDHAALVNLVNDARERLDENVGLHPYTQHLNDALTEQDKFNLVKALWQVAFSDGHADQFEEHTIRRAADLLYLSHTRFIEAKLSAKQGAK